MSSQQFHQVHQKFLRGELAEPFGRLGQLLFAGCVESATPFSLESRDRLLDQVLLLLGLALESVLLHALELVDVDAVAMFDSDYRDEMTRILGRQRPLLVLLSSLICSFRLALVPSTVLPRPEFLFFCFGMVLTESMSFVLIDLAVEFYGMLVILDVCFLPSQACFES
jgi:hypothetical protein